MNRPADTIFDNSFKSTLYIVYNDFAQKLKKQVPWGTSDATTSSTLIVPLFMISVDDFSKGSKAQSWEFGSYKAFPTVLRSQDPTETGMRSE